MQSQTNDNPKSARHSKEDIEKGEELVEKIWDGIMERGDDEIYEMNRAMSGLSDPEESEMPRRKRGRKI